MLRHLIELCVRRRLPALVVTAAIAAYGVNAYRSLPVEAYPDVSNVQVVVIAQLAGQAPEEIERQVTVPIERVLNGTPGTILMRSESLFGLSLVSLTASSKLYGLTGVSPSGPIPLKSDITRRLSPQSVPKAPDDSGESVACKNS